MRKLLLFFTLCLTSLGVRAATTPTWTDQPSSVTITEEDDGSTLVITSENAGDFQTFWANNISLANAAGYTKIKYVGSFGSFSFLQGGETSSGNIDQLTIPVMDVTGVTDIYGERQLTNPNVTAVVYNGGNSITGITSNGAGPDIILVDKNNKTATATLSGGDALADYMAVNDVNLDRITVTGTLSSDDAAVLDATAVDVSGATLTGDVSDIQGSASYISLPLGYESTDLEALKSKNPNLKLAISIGDLDTTTPKVVMHSFEENSVVAACNLLNNQAAVRSCKYVSMSGDYGDRDLVDGTSLNFGLAAVWDFTGASFAACTMDAASNVKRGPYYASDDPFQDNGTVTIPSNYTTNAFWKFSNYSTKVVDIKLPTGITELPPACLTRLGEENGDNYKLIHSELSAEDIQALEDELSATMTAMNKQYTSGSYYPIDELIIPEGIVTLGWECCLQSVIKNVVLGTGVKEVQGGAFKLNSLLENLDCKSGISECRLGDQAFNECNNMKHVVLSEGIISLGANCFNNSQHLESIRLPETLQLIGNYCFQDGHALSSITIPAEVEKIGMGAFALTALSDIYLMAEDPADVPIIYTAGSNWGDGKSTFGRNTMESNNTLVWDGEGDFSGKATKKIKEMTFDEAASAYFANCNRMAALHFSPTVAEKVLSVISASYGLTSTDGYGIPIMSNDDSGKRANAMGLADMGSTDQGIYTSYGWAQFLIQKEFTPDHPEVFTKEFDDVWYTMCFPFDLTDEQLAGAFNEGFNIVDFSGVEIQQPEENEDKKLTLILHFNTVAKTIYKDAEGNVYTVTGREPDGKFDYNVYERDGKTYKHVQVGTGGSGYKTKTFAENGEATNGIIEIDGILASAGHPYMVHPNTGANTGMPLVRCHFSGISWKDGDWTTLYEDEARTVDLGVAMGTITDDPKTCVPSAENFLQAAYSDYTGQTYTFIGNPKALKEGAPEEPTDQYQSYPTYPTTLKTYPPEPSLERGDEPQAPTDPTSTVGARKTEADAPTPVANPGEDLDTYPANFQALFKTVRCSSTDWTGAVTNYTYGEDLVAGGFGEFFWGSVGNSGDPLRYADHANLHSYISCDYTTIENYLGSADQSDIQDKFNALKSLAENFTNALPAYNAYLAELEAYQANIDAWNAYDTEYAQYESEHAAWESWTSESAQEAHDAWEQECEEIDEYNAPIISEYNSQCAAVDLYNKGIKDEWEASLADYKRLIPTNAYFLGRRGRGWPKYYREIADDTRTGATGGFWTEYTAVIVPNAAAIAGIETELGAGTDASANPSVEMVFDEGFLGEEKTVDEIEQIVAEAESEGQNVEYMQVVYNINGQIVREGTELTGLPKGIYIVNGKKYFVR